MGAILGWIASVFITIGSVIWSVVMAIIPILRQVFNTLVGVFNVLAPAVGRFARAVFDFAKKIWDNVLKPVVKTLVDWFDRFSSWLRRVMQPILDILERVAEAFDWVMSRIIDPILMWLERAKLFFQGLALLGIDWARSIVEIIDRVINTIQQGVDVFTTKLNEVIYYIDSLLDPGGWVKWTPWHLTFQHWHGATLNMLGSFGIDAHQVATNWRRQQEEHIPLPPSRWIIMFDQGETARLTGVRLAVARFESGQRLRG